MPRAKKPGTIDRVTRRWIRCAADERAAANGCRFDEERAQHAVDWIQATCHLYEGDHAGELIKLIPWQEEATKRIFGWVRRSEDWGREIRRFRQVSVWVPKKNGKSPLLAAWGLYLLCADGEKGQKVYSVAKDGKQALISHTHAMEMVRRSPVLSAECSVNKSTGQITHHPTSSFYKVVAGDNINSQEGLNGSIMVDETHVVDRRLMKVLKFAGASRSEPLHIEVSTAGNNPDGYGKEQWERGRQVEKGEKGYEDDELFFLDFSAPQELSDADLDTDPAKWGRMANPSWGYTIKEGEFLASYRKARVSLSDLADFKMYRLDIWQRSASPWLRMSDWDRCKRPFTEDDLIGRDCWAGLDLSKTKDMTSLVLTFRADEPETYYQLPFFWLPEATAHEFNHLVPFLAWAAQGFLFLTPGNVLDYGFVKSHFRKLAATFRIKQLAYDEFYAEETTQSLSEGSLDDKGQVIEEGTGVPRLPFKQTLQNFAAPTAEYERLVIAGNLWHNGHPIMTWQAGHVRVIVDANQNKRPIKPKQDDIRKIDGKVAGIMSLNGAMTAPPSGSIYDSHGLEVL